MRLFDFEKPIGIGPQGGYQTQVRVPVDSKGTMHGTPWGQEF